MYRISVTTLECYRKHLYEANEYATEESVINAMRGIFTGSPCYANIGSAFHQVVEMGDKGFAHAMGDTFEVTLGERDNNQKVILNAKQIECALSYRKKFRQAWHEVVLGAEFQTQHFPIWVEGRCDLLYGLQVRDIKTKYSPIKLEEYTESAQWKLYLELTELDDFYFDMFEFKGYKPDKYGWDVSSLELIPQYSIHCERYEDMILDNHSLVNDFVDFVVTHDLTQYLKIRE